MIRKKIAVLIGGPDGNALEYNAREPLRLLRGSGYERFECADEYVEIDGEQVPVYRWCYRTSIAE